MTVLNQKPIPLAIVKEYVGESEEKRPIDEYLKKFASLPKDKAEKLVEEVTALNNPKIKDADIAKIVDLLPQDAADLNKIFIELSLSDDEANQLLNIVKKY